MSAHKHTPGPYSITGGSYLGIIAIVNGKRTQIGRAEGCGGRISDEEVVRNARLFAYSIDLLDAVKLGLESIEGTSAIDALEVMAIMREAVARVEIDRP